MCASGAVGADIHLVLRNLARQGLYMLDSSWTSARKTQVERVDPQRLHQMQYFEFLLNGWITNRGRLQAIAQGFVIQLNRAAGNKLPRQGLVPVVDKFGRLHLLSS